MVLSKEWPRATSWQQNSTAVQSIAAPTSNQSSLVLPGGNRYFIEIIDTISRFLKYNTPHQILMKLMWTLHHTSVTISRDNTAYSHQIYPFHTNHPKHSDSMTHPPWNLQIHIWRCYNILWYRYRSVRAIRVSFVDLSNWWGIDISTMPYIYNTANTYICNWYTPVPFINDLVFLVPNIYCPDTMNTVGCDCCWCMKTYRGQTKIKHAFDIWPKDFVIIHLY